MVKYKYLHNIRIIIPVPEKFIRLNFVISNSMGSREKKNNLVVNSKSGWSINTIWAISVQNIEVQLYLQKNDPESCLIHSPLTNYPTS